MRVVLDASCIISAALKPNSIPEQALLLALREHSITLSVPVFNEMTEVLERPRMRRAVTAEERNQILTLLSSNAFWVVPHVAVTDCRDAKDNKYLELALAARAEVIVSGDADLLVLDPWRGVRILAPRDFLRSAGNEPEAQPTSP